MVNPASSTTKNQPILLKKQGNTEICIFQTDSPWDLPFDTLVIPASPRADFGGSFAQACLEYLGSESYESLLENTVESAKKSQNLDTIAPDKPLLVPLPSQIVKLLPTLPDKSVTERFLIFATVEPERTVANAFIAAEAVIEMAVRQGLTRLIIPLIGAGVNGLDASEVTVALLRAIQKALIAKKPDSQKIQSITIVARQSAPIEAARRLFPDNYLAQRAYNDLAEGQDLLNIQNEVHALAEVLLMREMEPPLAVGILGGWGSGKSFVMHLMQQKMNEIRSLPVNANKAWDKQNNSNSSELFPYVGHIYQIKFDAWTYAKSNLWASLMETIFFELNRQLTLEKQLKEAGIDPLKEPQIWSVLNEMSNEKREALLESKLSPDVFKNWKKIVCTQGLANSLWENLQILKTAEQKALNETQQELLKRQANLKETEKKLENEVNEEIAEEARNVVLRPITNKLKRELINTSLAELKKYLHLELNTTDENGKQQNIEKVEITLEKIDADTWATWKQFLLYDKRVIVGFILFIAFIPLSYILIAQFKKYVPVIHYVPAILPLIPGIPLLKKWKKWQKKVIKTVNDYLKELKQEQDKLAAAREEKLKIKLGNSEEIKRLQDEIKQLEVQAEGQSQQIGPTAKYSSLLDFVDNRLGKSLYGKQLGLMQQVKSDLAELTDYFILPKNCHKTQQLSEKEQHLQELFPRGPARVVLYIDDLDRCPPKRVVEVLEAVQLLVKTPLFVAVLAIDVRYVTRALEKVYAGILNRNGEPSGMHYIEKIIQIPYQVKPIESSALEGYLRDQMQVDFESEVPQNQINREENQSLDYSSRNNENSRTRNFQSQNKRNSSIQEDEPEALSAQAIKFSKTEFDIVLKCCKYVDLSPRTLKRMVNVYKLIKIIWFRSNQQIQVEKNQDLITVVVSFLAMSGRYPDIMRSVFDELKIHIEELETQKEQTANNTFQDFFTKYFNNYLLPYQDNYFRQEYKRFRDDVNTLLIPVNLTLDQSVLETFNIMRSFCFIGDIGYDPRDFISTAASNHE